MTSKYHRLQCTVLPTAQEDIVSSWRGPVEMLEIFEFGWFQSVWNLTTSFISEPTLLGQIPKTWFLGESVQNQLSFPYSIAELWNSRTFMRNVMKLYLFSFCPPRLKRLGTFNFNNTSQCCLYFSYGFSAIIAEEKVAQSGIIHTYLIRFYCHARTFQPFHCC